jgi:cysteine desulfurase / selenocysteine lyase
MNTIRLRFPIFQNHPELVYLDSAATTQTPQVVLDVMNEYYMQYRSNVHRSNNSFSNKATDAFETARQKVADFIGAQSSEIIFTSGTTMGLNMLQKSLTDFFEPGGNIVLTRLEHHANLIPWQMTAKKYNLELRFIEIDVTTGEIDMESVSRVIDEKTVVVSMTHVSNVLGTIVPVKEITRIAREKSKSLVIVDGSQAVAHIPVNVAEIDCDFYVFSGHKMYGPTGIGVVYGKTALLQKMKPVVYGGEMIDSVTYETATWADAPYRFEAGTPNIAGAIGLGAAVDFVSSLGWNEIQTHDVEIAQYAIVELQKIERVRVIGSTQFPRGPIISFVIDGVHESDVNMFLEKAGIAVRSGSHCAAPLIAYLGLSGTIRISCGIYTTTSDIDRCIVILKKIVAQV